MPDVVEPVPGQIWRDDCYYLQADTGECRSKYVLVLALAKDGDLITAVFTSKSNGLPELPLCFMGPPRAGFFVGAPGGVLTRPTWVDFSSLQDLDRQDFSTLQKQGRLHLIPKSLPPNLLCGVLRCILGFEDLTGRQGRIIADLAASLACP